MDHEVESSANDGAGSQSWRPIETAPTAAQQAYGLLWRDNTPSPLIHRARKILLATLTTDEQREAIEWATREVGQMTTEEVLQLRI